MASFSRTIHGAGGVIGGGRSGAASSVEAKPQPPTLDAANTFANSRTAFRNLPKLCSFWLNGACNRVVKKTCPFRPCCGSYAFPEIAGSDKEACAKLVSDLNTLGPVEVMKHLDPTVRAAIQASMRGNRDDAIRQRVSGDDGLTKKYLNKMKSMQMNIQTPSDESITTLWLGNLDTEQLTDTYLRELLYSYGHIVGVHIVKGGNCAFVEFASRDIAEQAANLMHNALVIGGKSVSVNWAKPRSQGASVDSASSLGQGTSSAAIVMPPPPGLERAPVSSYALQNMSTPLLPPPPPGAPPSSITHQGSNSQSGSGKRKLDESAVSVVSTQVRGESDGAKHSKTAAVSYPSTNPSRLGAYK